MKTAYDLEDINNCPQDVLCSFCLGDDNEIYCFPR